MKKFEKLLALVLAVVMIVGMLPMVASAAGGEDEVDPLVLDKSYDPVTGTLRLEAYATGTTIHTHTEKVVPCDIVLLLDTSGSMSKDYGLPLYVPSSKTSFKPNDFSTGYYSTAYYYKYEGKYYRVRYEQVTAATGGYTQVTDISPDEVTTTGRTSWTLFSRNNTQYYYKVAEGDYRPIYYQMVDHSSIGVIIGIRHRYYRFAYKDDSGNYVSIYGTTGTDANTGMDGDTDFGTSRPIYVEAVSTAYRAYYLNADGAKRYIGNAVPNTNTTAYTGTLYTLDNDASRIKALRVSVAGFIDTVAENAKGPDGVAGTEDDVEHRISIVRYSSAKWPTGQNEASLTEGNNNGRTELVKNLTDVSTGAGSLKTAVNSLSTGGDTASDYGFEKAQYVLDDTYNTAYCREKSNKIVVMFTDGVPNHGGNPLNPDTANAAVKNAKVLKDKGVTVYTIGLFSDPSNDVLQYMTACSSNYPKAESYTQPDEGSDQGYFLRASEDMDLDEIFEIIASDTTSGSARISLDTESVLVDTMSEYFQLPEGVSTDDIRVHSADYEGNGTWSDNDDYDDYDIDIEGKSVAVTGFDYSTFYVDTTTSGLNGKGQPGRKIVVEIPAVPDPSAPIDPDWVFEDPNYIVPTNTEDSGIYDDGKPVDYFETPEALVPTFKVIHCGRTVYGEGETGATEIYPVCDTFDLTKCTAEGVLYGGGFTNVECTEPVANGMAISPEAGDVYYIWEVNTDHLQPKTLSVWKHNGAGDLIDVVDLYFLTAIDRKYYASTGFDVEFEGDNYNYEDFNNDYSVAYEWIHISDKDNKDYTYYNLLGKCNGSLTGAVRVQDFKANYGKDNFVVMPYWVTLDNIKVTGTVERTCAYQGEGAAEPENNSNIYRSVSTVTEVTVDSVLTAQPVKVNKPLMLMSRFSMTSAPVVNGVVEPEPEVIEEPEEPEVPEEPEIPEEPEVPVQKLTVNDNGASYEVEIADGAVALTPAGANGKLFAGWYVDEACTKAADLNAVSDGMAVYAKYISNKYLTVKYTENLLTKKLSVVAAIDAKNYAETGFVVEINGASKVLPVKTYATRYMLLSGSTLFGSSIAKNAPLFDTEFSFASAKSGSKITITPYLITKDGTTVYGEKRVLTYTGWAIK